MPFSSTPAPLIAITADDRERPCGIPEILADRTDVALEIQHLTLGDYAVGEELLFERKTIPDFAASLLSGRLFSQASRLAAAHRRTALIIEGDPEAWSETRIGQSALHGTFASLGLVFGLALLHTRDPEETASILIYAGRQQARARTGGDAAWNAVKAKRKATRRRRLLQQLPGIGPERAKRLLQRFGTIHACCQAAEHQLREVEGIGPETARGIHDTLNEDPVPYGRCRGAAPDPPCRRRGVRVSRFQ